MKDILEGILTRRVLTPEEQEALRTALEADPPLADFVARWQGLEGALARSLREHLPDRHLFVLYALDAEGRTDLLSGEERHRLEAARPQLDRACEVHPALADVVRRIQEDRAVFEEVWQQHEQAGRQAAASVRADRGAGRRRHRPVGRRWAWRAAAATAVAVFVVVLASLFNRDNSLITVRTAPGEVRLVELADGSTVRLLGGSQLSYLPPGETAVFARQARLLGRAYFEVVQDAQHFTVETPTARAVVLGTSFGIQAGEAMTEVVLASGKLALAPKAAPDRLVVMAPGEMSRVAAGALPSTPAPVDLARVLDWTGLFIFQSAPASDITARLAQHYRRDITVAPALVGQQVTGTFEQEQPLEEILHALAATLGATLQPTADGGFRLSAQPPR